MARISRTTSETLVWARAKDRILEPSSRQTVGPDIYEELRMRPGISGVLFDRVVILCGFDIMNSSARGIIIVPSDTTNINLRGSTVLVKYWSWERIRREFGLKFPTV